ncbi:MAG: diguanylate cyclase [Gammaproteobacteria bacterium]|nr:diguanylate cyclase [Gammaproteobacteria bacterium]
MKSGFIPDSSKKHLLLRFLGATLVPTTFLCIAISFGLLNIHSQYLFTQKEVAGAQVVHLLFDAFIDLQKVRGLSRIVSWSKASELAAQRQKIMVDFNKHLADLQSHELIYELDLVNEVSSIVRKANNLFVFANGASSEAESFGQYTIMIEELNSIALIVADRSNLILDPELDTYYLIEVAIKQIPDLCEAFGSIRGLGSGMIARGSSTATEHEQYKEKVSIMYDQLKRFNRAMSIIQAASTGAKSLLQRNASKLDQALDEFLQPCGSGEGFNCSLSAETFFQRGTDTIDILAEMFSSNTDLLQARLRQRLSSYRYFLILTLLLSAVTIAAIFYFSFSFYRLQKDSYQKLEEIAITDPLTSIPNRRYLDMIFNREMQRIRRDCSGVAFGLLDIDFFKQFNDTYGHSEGDFALQQIASALQSSLQRADDYCFRFGGEEFCFMFHAKSIAEVKTVGERIRATVERLKIKHRENSVSHFVTISLGVAFLPKVTNESLGYMTKQADNLLYQAKETGRNKCVAVDLSTQI